MSKVELESFLKSFLLFFSSLSVLISTLFYLNYIKEIKTIDENLFSQMRVCSFDLKCENFTIDFTPIKDQELYTLYKDQDGLHSYFPINEADTYYLTLHFEENRYKEEIQKINSELLILFLITIGIIFILSILFSIYVLYPLRTALLLTQEFIKDILHDFNTPLSVLRLNSFMLKREIGEDEKVLRIEQGIENILNLQENLKAYLFDYQQLQENVDVEKLINERVSLIQRNYLDITFIVDIKDLKIDTNLNAFTRICDNIITNAAKYNKKSGKISVIYNKEIDTLSFIDTGKGIKNPSKVFNRFYKEQERGIGIGLHIVKKLCDELNIKIDIKSELNIGTNFSLKLTKK